jgi:beta-aspartyl-peptidase (threonine type)
MSEGAESAPTIVVHAGAGAWATGTDAAVAASERAAASGREVLADGGDAVSAVQHAIRVLEDDPACNAGTGAALTSEGTLELDACIVDGRSGRSGAIGALPPFRHPIDIAKAVMDDGRFILLVADGAAAFARASGFEPSTLGEMIVHHDEAPSGNTVGAAALDRSGGLAAGTSTGGIAGKAPGRLGDTPILGAATHADLRLACSWTGQGEAIARALGAFWTTLLADEGAEEAARRSLQRVGEEFGGLAGLVALDVHGRVGVDFNTRAMPHCTAVVGGQLHSGS